MIDDQTREHLSRHPHTKLDGDVSKKTMKQFAEPNLKHTHVAVDDAIEQGYLFLNLLKARKEVF